MKEYLKKNALVVIAFSVPIVFVGIIFLMTALPSMFFSTQYNFVYAVCNDPTSIDHYNNQRCQEYLKKKVSVVDGRISIKEDPTYTDTAYGYPDAFIDEVGPRRMIPIERTYSYEKELGYKLRLLLYDVRIGQSREISQEEAKSMHFSDLITSPEGVSIESGYDSTYNSPFFFDTSSSYNRYLKKGNQKKKLNLLDQSDRYYNGNFQFVGWVIP